MRSRTPLQRSCLILQSVYGVSWYRRPRSIVAGVVWIPKVCFRHREPQSAEKLKALVVRVRRDFGPLVQNAGQAQRKHGSDPLAPLLARKIRERLIRHGISHRVGRIASWDCPSSPGLCMPLGRKWARDCRGQTVYSRQTLLVSASLSLSPCKSLEEHASDFIPAFV